MEASARGVYTRAMIFDRWWREARKAAHRQRQRNRKYEELLGKARAVVYETDLARRNALAALDADFYFDAQTDNTLDILATEITVNKARGLGIPIPPRPSKYQMEDDEHDNAKENWTFNAVTGDVTLTEVGQFQLRQAIRKEETERLQHRMRFVSLVVNPLLAFVVALLGVLATVFAYLAGRHAGAR